MNRRTFLATITGSVAFATGCVQDSDSAASETTVGDTSSTDTRRPVAERQTATSELPTQATDTRQTDTTFTRGTQSAGCPWRYTSEIRIEGTQSSIENTNSPIVFSELPPEEQALLRKVIQNGRVLKCEPSPTFERFVGRVSEKVVEGEPVVFLKRGDTYYRLYVRTLDEVVTY